MLAIYCQNHWPAGVGAKLPIGKLQPAETCHGLGLGEDIERPIGPPKGLARTPKGMR
jgi:hypothetical protein